MSAFDEESTFSAWEADVLPLNYNRKTWRFPLVYRGCPTTVRFDRIWPDQGTPADPAHCRRAAGLPRTGNVRRACY